MAIDTDSHDSIHDTIVHQTELPDTAPEEGNPKGTYFVVITLLVLIALVAVYFWSSHYYVFREDAFTGQPKIVKDYTPGGVY